MRLASNILSLCLHAAVLLMVWYWPTPPPVRLDAPPMMISLVEGDPGGNRTPSPILGHMGQPDEGPLAPTPPAAKSEIAAPERVPIQEPAPKPSETVMKKPEIKPVPVEEAIPVSETKQDIPKPEPEPEPEPAKPEPKKEPPKPEPAKPEPPKPEPKKEEPRKEEPKKEEPKKPAQAKPVDPIAEALAQAKRKATSRADSGDRGSAIEKALAQAKRKAGGNRGGGGGEGEGPGGGGLGDVYIGEVMLAVRPNWGFAQASRVNYICVIKVKVEMDGKVRSATVQRSSGNPQFDASAVNSVIRTSSAGDFPPPPSQEYTDLDLVFIFNELTGR